MNTKTLYAKLATVPAPIKGWLGSDTVVASIDAMDDRFTLPTGSSAIISKLIQKIQIKDIIPDYFSGELASELKLDKDKAIHITEDIKKNIFYPIRQDLSNYGINIDLLDKFQIPPIASPLASSPKIFKDVNTSSVPTSSSVKPLTVSDIGWAKQPATMSTDATSTANNIIPRPSTTPMPTVAASAIPTPPAEPAPMMLHEDTTFKPAEKNANFTLPRQGMSAEVTMNRSGVPTPPQKAAVLEFGLKPATVTPPPRPTTFGAPTQSYSGFKPSLASTPTGNSGPRNVSQITPVSAAPAIPVPPAPVAAPAPANVAPITSMSSAHTPSATSIVPVPIAPKIPRTPQVWDIPAKPAIASSSVPVPTPPKPPTPGAAPAPASGTPQRPITKDFL